MWLLLPSKFAQSPHTLHLWFSRVGATTIDLSLVSTLSPTEKKRLALTRSPYKRREFLFSRVVMRHALSQYFPRPENEWIFIERPDLPPEIRNLPDNIYISLSHSKGHICFAISTSPVGIDIELVDRNRDILTLAKMFMSKEEIQYMTRNKETQAEFFYRIWCTKEAFYKATHLAHKTGISYKDIPTMDLINNKGNWHLIEGQLEHFLISAIVKNKPQGVSYNYFPQPDSTYLFTLREHNSTIAC